MGKYGFDDYSHEKTFHDDSDIIESDGAGVNYKEEEDYGEAEIEIMVCEDCNHRWKVEAREEADLFDYYNGDRTGRVCPMCGSFSIYNEQE